MKDETLLTLILIALLGVVVYGLIWAINTGNETIELMMEDCNNSRMETIFYKDTCIATVGDERFVIMKFIDMGDEADG